MTKWADDPEAAVGRLLEDVLEAWGGADGDVLTVDLPHYLLNRDELAGAVRWSRRVGRAEARVSATPWPAEAPSGAGFARAIVRLPRGRYEVDMTITAALSRLRDGGDLWLVGGNDEGIRGGFRRLQELSGRDGETLAQRGHGRVVRCISYGPPLNDTLAEWRRVGMIDLGDGPRRWVKYGGTFNKGELDEGTALLIAQLPTVPLKARVLDFAAGLGTIAAAVLNRTPSAIVTLLDNDTVALEAARENVPGADAFLAAARLDHLPSGTFDGIVSNPPIHDGFREDYGVLHHLIDQAPRLLAPAGQLFLVVQRRIALERTLAASFDRVETIADNGRYRVFSAREPKSTKGKR
jgi:16S rRNA (guanine1207-N2)-methyltransferase